nr:MAG TPA: hypothetical protein [Bacteriophage sp.]
MLRIFVITYFISSKRCYSIFFYTIYIICYFARYSY